MSWRAPLVRIDRRGRADAQRHPDEGTACWSGLRQAETTRSTSLSTRILAFALLLEGTAEILRKEQTGADEEKY